MASPDYMAPVPATQQAVIDWLLSHPTGIIFIHGKAGSGKTWLIRQIEQQMPGCQVLTPTNLAAMLYRRGRTIHSFFNAGLDDLDEGYQNPENLDESRALRMRNALQDVEMIVIDEVSMVRADLLEMVNRICQEACGSDLPFGGIPMVLVGDMFQLPPIVTDEATSNYLLREYGGPYFFNSHVIQDNMDSIRLFELEHSFRQKGDPEFVRLLDAFRRPLTPQEKVDLLAELNSRVTSALPDDAVYIASSNDQVTRINAERLAILPGQLTELEAEYRIKLRGSDQHVALRHSQLPIDKDIHQITLPTAYDGVLRFKIGARVMLTKNSKYFGYCNGDFGTVTGFDGTKFSIRLDNGREIQCPHPQDRYKHKQLTDYRYDMEYDAKRHKLVRKTPFIQMTRQFPVKLAYAFTIHKSQGQTFDKVILDLTSHIFAPGQLYVALSRARSLDSLFLTKEIAYSDIIADDAIFAFLNTLRRKAAGMAAAEMPKASRIPEWAVNPRCDDFISFMALHEADDATRDFISHTLRSYKSVFALGQHAMAMAELTKVIDLVCAAYVTDRYAEMLSAMHAKGATDEDCRYCLNAIFEIYTDVVHSPRRQVVGC